MFGGGNKKRGFVRESVSSTEKTLSYAMLLLILGIGTAIYFKGQSFDPNLFALDQSYIQNAQTDTRESLKLFEPGFGPDGEITAAQAKESTSPFDQLAPSGWKPLGKEEHFTADTLYEKINGRAEQYIRYGVNGMSFMGFTNGNQFVDVFVYDMEKPIQAYGIYSVERTEGASKTTFGREGYRVEASYFFWKGPYYGQIIASDTGPEIQKIGEQIAQTLSSRLPDDGEALWGNAILPQENRVPDSFKYFKQDALSLDFLTKAFTASYPINGQETTAFISRSDTPTGAQETFQKYNKYITDYGDVLRTSEAAGVRFIVGDMGGLYDVVFLKGDYVGGVTYADNSEAAVKWVQNWLQQNAIP